MRFLSVAERELRAAARQRKTYRLRWIVAAGAFALLLWLGWAFDVFANRSAGLMVFQVCSVIIFLACLLIGAADTADCISREKREGTLGLLFLTNLNSAEIVAGKLCSNGLALIYPLLATFPILALPVLIGGITFGHFWRTVLALANGLFFAMAAGFTASALSLRQVPAVAMATGLALFFGLGMSGVAALIRHWGYPAFVADTVAAFCPFRSLLAAGNAPRLLGDYWFSLAAVAGMSWTWLALVAWRVGRTWRDRAKGVNGWSRFGLRQRIRNRGSGARVALRRRLLEINPFFWLAGRQRVSAPIFMLLTVVLVCITVGLTAPYFGRVIRAGSASPMVGQLIAWLWTGLAIHVLVLSYAATVASQRLAEDKQTGALELILSSPTTERSISRGLWLAYGRRMLFPVLIALLVHFFFIWHCATMCLLDPPGKLPPGITPWQLFWRALLDQPTNGLYLDWEFAFMFRILLLVLVALIANWFMLGWVGRWLGLRMKHAGFAPIAAVFLALAPPTLLFSLVCYLADRWNLTRMPERQFAPMMMWIAFGIWIGNCLLLSARAAVRLRRDFRTTVTSRFEPPPQRRSWIPSRRVLLRFAAAATALVLTLVLTVLLFRAFQMRQSQRRWTAFQKELRQRGESLDLSAVLATPVPAAQNFAQSQAFQNLLGRTLATNAPARLLDKSPDYSAQQTPGNSGLTSWTKQEFVDFDQPLKWVDPSVGPGAAKDRKTSASAVSNGLKPLQDDMAAVAAAARLPFFQAATNRNPEAVLQRNPRELVALQRLHFIFQLRACALLALNRETEAGEDVLTSLRLAHLARQSPDVNSTFRVQTMLACSLQPVWEGLAKHRWSEPQLAAFQKELARFDLLSDHTNAIGRIVLAYVETWRALPDAKAQPGSLPQAGGVYVRHRDWMWPPRTWWYDNCRQLYRAGEHAIARVDAAAGRVSDEVNWVDLRGLPLDGNITQMFQQFPWWGNSPMLVAFAQTAANQAVIACALERYRLAHGAYPEALDQLLPAYLDSIPRDISRGRPMFYQRDEKDSYVLRGAGPNGIIEHGKGPSDDWLWSFTAPPTNAPAGGTQQK
jgi:ABC-type transport system involved in cytochrome c biogenesis permease component